MGLSMGGNLLVSDSSSQMIRGQWLTTGESVRISQWDNDPSCQQYKRTSLMVLEHVIPELASDITQSLSVTFRHKPEFIAPKKSPPAGGPVCLIVRFPENRIRQIRTFFKENWEIVDEMDGVPLAFAPKITLSEERNDWPAEMALFFVMFSKAAFARECYTKLNGIGVNNEFTTCDVLLADMVKKIEIQEECNFFNIDQFSKTDEAVEIYRKADKEKIATFTDCQEKVRKIRLEFGGKILISKEPKQLHGSWSKANGSLTLKQWPSLDSYNQFKNAKKERLEKELTLCSSYLKSIWSGNFSTCSLFDESEKDGVTEIIEVLKVPAV